MTIDELLDKCRAQVDALTAIGATASTPYEIARGVLDLLGESQPCGMEQPDTFQFSDGTPGVGIGEDTMSAVEARALAAMTLRAADKSEADAQRERIGVSMEMRS